jgi:hypothetical protein
VTESSAQTMLNASWVPLVMESVTALKEPLEILGLEEHACRTPRVLWVDSASKGRIVCRDPASTNATTLAVVKEQSVTLTLISVNVFLSTLETLMNSVFLVSIFNFTCLFRKTLPALSWTILVASLERCLHTSFSLSALKEEWESRCSQVGC